MHVCRLAYDIFINVICLKRDDKKSVIYLSPNICEKSSTVQPVVRRNEMRPGNLSH